MSVRGVRADLMGERQREGLTYVLLLRGANAWATVKISDALLSTIYGTPYIWTL